MSNSAKSKKSPSSIDHLDKVLAEHKRKVHAASDEALKRMPPGQRSGSMFAGFSPEVMRNVKIVLKR